MPNFLSKLFVTGICHSRSRLNYWTLIKYRYCYFIVKSNIAKPIRSIPFYVVANILIWTTAYSEEVQRWKWLPNILLPLFLWGGGGQALRAACRILVPWPGIEPGPRAVRAWSPNHWTVREVPACCLFSAASLFLFVCCWFVLVLFLLVTQPPPVIRRARTQFYPWPGGGELQCLENCMFQQFYSLPFSLKKVSWIFFCDFNDSSSMSMLYLHNSSLQLDFVCFLRSFGSKYIAMKLLKFSGFLSVCLSYSLTPTLSYFWIMSLFSAIMPHQTR